MERKEMPDLTKFRGTENYWQWCPGSKIALTDGVKYLIDQLNTSWLISKVEYFLTSRKKIDGIHMIGIELTVKKNGDAKLTLKNDFGTYGTYTFRSTDFPLEGIFLYAYPYEKKWIIMLPSEY